MDKELKIIWNYHLQASVYVMHIEIQITSFSPEFMYPEVGMWCDQAKSVWSWSNSVFIFLTNCMHHFHILQKTPLKLVNWFQRYEQLKNAKINRKQKKFSVLFGSILKSIFPTSDRFCLITSHMCIGHICIQLYTREHCQHMQLAGFKLFTLNLKIKTITNRRILIELIRGAIPLPFTNPSISLYKLAMSVAYWQGAQK